MDKLLNITALIADQIAFGIRSFEPEFTDEGELSGYVLVDSGYNSGSERAELAGIPGFFQADAGGESIDDFAMLDGAPALAPSGEGEWVTEETHEEGWLTSDSRPELGAGFGRVYIKRRRFVSARVDGRWAHERDSFLAEQEAIASAMLPHPGDERELFDSNARNERDQRWFVLRSKLERMELAHYRWVSHLGRLEDSGRANSPAAKLVRTRIARLEAGAERMEKFIATEYTKRRDEILADAEATESAPQWWRQWLTSEQAWYLRQLARFIAGVSYKRVPQPTPAPVTPCPTADRDSVPGFWGEWLAMCLLTA